MTPEEAAEEILDGKPYTACRRCNGSGWTTKPTRNYAIGFRDYCDSCQGSGQWLRGDYVTACIIVGKDPPPKPRTTMYLAKDAWEPKEWKKKLSDFGKPFPHFEELLKEHETKFRKEYMGKWETIDQRGDLADSMKYSLEAMKVHSPKQFKL